MTRMLILFALFVFLFPGCRSRPDQATGQVRISVWTSNNPFELEWTRQVVDRWHRIHPEIQVTSQPIPEGRSSEEILMASVVARTTPDVFLNLSPAIVERLRQAGALLPVSSFETLDSFLWKRLPPESYRMFVSPDGKLYQIPWKCNPIMTYYNKRIFRELGLAPPRTYSDWFRCARAVRESKQNRWMISLNTSAIWWQRFFDLYPLYIAASGGRVLFDSEGNPAFRNKDFVAVTEFLKANFEHQYTPLEEAPGDPFIQQKAAFGLQVPGSSPPSKKPPRKILNTMLPHCRRRTAERNTRTTERVNGEENTGD